MTVSKFAKKVTQKEGLKKQVNIAQILEILKVMNILTKNALYKLIRGL